MLGNAFPGLYLIFLHFLGLRLLSCSGLNRSPSSNFGSVKSSVVLVLLVLLASETKRYDWILFTKLFGPNFLKGRCSYHAGFLYPAKLVFFYVLVIIQERVWHRWLLIAASFFLSSTFKYFMAITVCEKDNNLTSGIWCNPDCAKQLWKNLYVGRMPESEWNNNNNNNLFLNLGGKL